MRVFGVAVVFSPSCRGWIESKVKMSKRVKFLKKKATQEAGVIVGSTRSFFFYAILVSSSCFHLPLSPNSFIPSRSRRLPCADAGQPRAEQRFD